MVRSGQFLRDSLTPQQGPEGEPLELVADPWKNDLHTEQVRLLYTNANVAVVATILVSSALGYLQFSVVRHVVVLSWLAYMILEAFAVLALSSRFQQARRSPAQTQIWGVAFLVGSSLSAAGWGAAGVLLYPASHLAHQVPLAFVIGGMMLGSGSILASRPAAFVAFLILAGIPTALRFIVQGDEVHVAMGLLILFFTAAVLITTWHIHQAVTSSLILGFENNGLLRDLRAATAQLEALNQELEQRVESRTAELDAAVSHLRKEISERQRAEDQRTALEASLRQAQKLEAIGVLAGGIAHDFNNLLTSIAGYTTLVRDTLPADAEATGHLEEVLKASTRAGNLVRRLLMFSRKGQHRPRLVSVSEVVSEALDVVRASLPSRILFHQSIHPDSGSVFADPNLLAQVILNLCTNSCEAMAGNGGELHVSLEPVQLVPPATVQSGLAEGPYVRLKVRDTGPGIPPEIAERIFEPFFTTKPHAKGAGLGLSVVHGVVTTYGGGVILDSRAPDGAVFSVFLPRQPAGAKTRVEASELPQSRCRRILLVDDEESIARLGALMLRRLGHSVTSTTSSVKALRLFLREPDSFDVVITDLTMPQMTGKELIRRIKQVRANIPVVLMSGFNDASVKASEAASLGIVEFLEKPFSRPALTDAIRKALQRHPNSTIV